MKIYCEKCNKDISTECCKNIENYKVGHVICPDCHFEQKRYISEADLLLYFGINEIIYVILSFLMMFIFDRLKVSLLAIVMLLMIIIVFFFISKNITMSIYKKAFFKEEIKNKEFVEDAKVIQRNIAWQFMLFFAIIITYITVDEGKIFFACAIPIAIILNFVKFFLQVRNEKSS